MKNRRHFLAILVTCGYSLVGLGIESNPQPPPNFSGENRTLYAPQILTDKSFQVTLKDIDNLIALKDKDLCGVNLDDLKQRVQKIKFGLVDGEPIVGSGYRNGALNLPEEKVVLYNLQKMEGYSIRQKTILRWHETFGAAGFDDDNYFLSVVVAIKLTSRTTLHPELTKRFVQQFNRTRIQKDKTFGLLAAGGATGVGGGGDGVTAEIKWMLISYMNQFSTKLGTPEQTTELLDLAIDTPLESLEFKDKYSGLITYHQLSIGINMFNTQMTILIKESDWISPDENGSVVRQENIELINEIIDVLRALSEKSRK